MYFVCFLASIIFIETKLISQLSFSSMKVTELIDCKMKWLQFHLDFVKIAILCILMEKIENKKQRNSQPPFSSYFNPIGLNSRYMLYCQLHINCVRGLG